MAAVAKKTLTLTAYAKRRGVSVKAVSKAVKAGRLKESVGKDRAGRPSIVDADLADVEWEANSDPSTAPATLKTGSFQAARTRRESLLAETAELKLRRMRGELVEASEVERHLVDVFTRCRTKLLAIPSRARQQLPHLTAGDVGMIERLVREALEDLADEGAP